MPLLDFIDFYEDLADESEKEAERIKKQKGDA